MFDFFSGVACAAALGASVFFTRFFRDTADRFFALFALAFAVLALNWLTVSWFAPLPETRA